MIAQLKGELISKAEDYIIIDVNGVGYEVSIPTSLHNNLPELGTAVMVYTHTYVREDRFVLYGFLQQSELQLFRQLLKISKIGPKVAIGILSALQVRDFKLAITQEDIETLKQVKGIGKKTAQRLILELKGKIDLEELTTADESIEQSTDQKQRQEAVQGLVNLGYKKSQAQQVVQSVASDLSSASEVEEIIKLALQELGQQSESLL
ncbi:MAG: Holliday junction branch migration protein RuvA [Bacillota bacterium]